MADDVQITPGAGVSVATDDVGGIHYQKIKLFSAADGVAVPYGDEDLGASRALWVAPRRDFKSQLISSAGLTTATPAYTIGDVVGTGWEVPNFVREAGGISLITSFQMIDLSDVMAAYDVLFCNEAATIGADNAAFSPDDANVQKIEFFLTSMTAPFDIGGARVGQIPAHTNPNTSKLDLPIKCVGTSLFVYIVTRSANAVFAAGADSLKLRITYERI